MIPELPDDGSDVTAVEGVERRCRVSPLDEDVTAPFDTGSRRTHEPVSGGTADAGTEPGRPTVTREGDDHGGAFDETVDRYGVEAGSGVATGAIEPGAKHAIITVCGEDPDTDPFTAVVVPDHGPGRPRADESAPLAATDDALI
jgi:hypothetical protein